MKKYYLLLSILMVLLTGGCSMKTPHAIDIFTLKHNTVLDKKYPAIFPDKVLKVALVQSTKEIKTKKILYSKRPYKREAYAYSRWSDTPNQMIEQFLVTTLNQSTLFKAVIPATSLAKSDFILESNIIEFYQAFDKDKHSFATVKISFFLIDQKDKTVVSKYTINSKVLTQSLDAKGGVYAFNRALDQISTELIHWLQNIK